MAARQVARVSAGPQCSCASASGPSVSSTAASMIRFTAHLPAKANLRNLGEDDRPAEIAVLARKGQRRLAELFRSLRQSEVQCHLRGLFAAEGDLDLQRVQA